jgi:hypothetical protein
VGGGVRRDPPPALAPDGGDVLLALAWQVGERALHQQDVPSVPAGLASAVSGSMISRTCQCISRCSWCTHVGQPEIPYVSTASTPSIE